MSPHLEYKVSLFLLLLLPSRCVPDGDGGGRECTATATVECRAEEGKALEDKPGEEKVAGVKRTFSRVGKSTQNKTYYV